MLALIFTFFQVYYPFDQDAISVTDQGGKKVFVISTENDIVAYVGENYFTMQVKFDNSAQPTTQGNWPRGTCCGPYPLGIVSYIYSNYNFNEKT